MDKDQYYYLLSIRTNIPIKRLQLLEQGRLKPTKEEKRLFNTEFLEIE